MIIAPVKCSLAYASPYTDWHLSSLNLTTHLKASRIALSHKSWYRYNALQALFQWPVSEIYMDWGNWLLWVKVTTGSSIGACAITCSWFIRIFGWVDGDMTGRIFLFFVKTLPLAARRNWPSQSCWQKIQHIADLKLINLTSSFFFVGCRSSGTVDLLVLFYIRMRMKNLTAVFSSPFDTVGVCHGFPSRENGNFELVLLGQLLIPVCYWVMCKCSLRWNLGSFNLLLSNEQIFFTDDGCFVIRLSSKWAGLFLAGYSPLMGRLNLMIQMSSEWNILFPASDNP